MDGLTGLPDREEAFSQMEMAIYAVQASREKLVVALVDLDRFYQVNEVMGTEFGNEVLRLIGRRLVGVSASLPLVNRLGGDAFLIALPLKSDEQQAIYAVETIKNAIERPIEINGTEHYLTTSIGVTVYPRDGRTGEELICRAEAALHQSKELGGNRVQFYDYEYTEQVSRRVNIEAELRPALALQQFHLSYQPIYRMGDGRLKGFEALIRWHHPELGEVEPAEFIPVAEYNGLIHPIGEWVLRESCRMLSTLHQYGMCSLTMSINLSPYQLQNPSFPQTVMHIAREHGLALSALELEMIEHELIFNSAAALSSLSSLRAAGVRIMLDHFGKGCSSLANLQKLPIQCLKIDKSFIKKIDVDSGERIIAEGVIRLVQKLGLEVIAEGVEYEGQYSLLREWGCDYVQGFLLSKPTESDILDLSMIRRTEAAGASY